MKKLAVALSLVCFSVGCMNAFQKQNLSDARAGAQAIGSHPLSAPPVQAIAKGVDGHINAAALLQKLPAPQSSPEKIIGNPDAYKKQGEDAEKEAESMGGGFWAGLGGILLGGGLLVARNAGPLGSMAANLFTKLSPHARKNEDRAKLGLGIIASTEVGMMGLDKLEKELPVELVGKVLTELSGGQSTSIKGYLKLLMKQDQVDRNIQVDVASLRKEVLHSEPTKGGELA